MYLIIFHEPFSSLGYAWSLTFMDILSLTDARKLIEQPLSRSESGIPSWFTDELIPLLFPVERRPVQISITTPPISPGQMQRTSARREQDEARRKAMHTLVTNWDKSAKRTSKQLVEALFRGARPVESKLRFPGALGPEDAATVRLFHSLIPDATAECDSILDSFAQSVPSPIVQIPVASIGGYTVTETVGPLSMLTEVVKRRETVTIWVKEKLELSHGRRRARIKQKEGRIVLFDRHMNLVFVPLGNPADCWQFVRGSVVALVQRTPRSSLCGSPSSSSFKSSSQSSSRSG